MYEERFGLKKNPFRMAPDTGFLFLTDMHREALVGLAYAVLNRKGFTVLTGDAGTGKSTLLHRILESLPARSSYVTNPTLSPAEFLEYAMLDFGIDDVPVSKARRLVRLQEFLMDAREKEEVAVLIVDEAQCLSREVLEEIRLLTNFETAEGKLLQIILAGQNELSEILNRQDLRQLKQRISVRLSLSPLTGSQTARYVVHRWRKAGATVAPPFASEAISRIHAYSGGIPRSVNALCDNSLVQAVGRGADRVTDEHVRAAARDLDMAASGLSASHPARRPRPPRRAEPAKEEPIQPAEDPVSDPEPAPAQDRPGLLGRFKRGIGLAGVGGVNE